TAPEKKSLEDAVQYLKGVGPSRASDLRRLGIENVNDLLTHFPRTYYDRRQLAPIASLVPGVEATFVGRVLSVTQRNPFRRRSAMVVAAVQDASGIVQVVWFNQPYLGKSLKAGRELIISGRLGFYRGQRQVVNPEFEFTAEDEGGRAAARIMPVYRL